MINSGIIDIETIGWSAFVMMLGAYALLNIACRKIEIRKADKLPIRNLLRNG